MIVIGIREKKSGKTRVANEIDEGIVSSEWLQQTVESNVSPYLPGIRFHRPKLSRTKSGRIPIVIDVPKGTTAYQPRDRRYYGRFEYEVKALPDHEIRLMMMRPRIAQARLEVVEFKRDSFEERAAAWSRVDPFTHHLLSF